MESGEADRTVRLYEMFLSGCYEKVEEVDDSGGNLGMPGSFTKKRDATKCGYPL